MVTFLSGVQGSGDDGLSVRGPIFLFWHFSVPSLSPPSVRRSRPIECVVVGPTAAKAEDVDKNFQTKLCGQALG